MIVSNTARTVQNKTKIQFVLTYRPIIWKSQKTGLRFVHEMTYYL